MGDEERKGSSLFLVTSISGLRGCVDKEMAASDAALLIRRESVTLPCWVRGITVLRELLKFGYMPCLCSSNTTRAHSTKRYEIACSRNAYKRNKKKAITDTKDDL